MIYGHVEVEWGFKSIVECYHKWRIQFFHDICFTDGIFELLFCDESSFIEDLQCIYFVCLEISREINLAKRAASNHLNELKIFVRDAHLFFMFEVWNNLYLLRLLSESWFGWSLFCLDQTFGIWFVIWWSLGGYFNHFRKLFFRWFNCGELLYYAAYSDLALLKTHIFSWII